MILPTISPVYRVGGSVRDSLLGRPVHDYDFTTPMSPDEIEAAIRSAGKKPYLIGKRFGTLMYRHEGQEIEVTTFRKETYTEGSRKPDVEFVTDITDDLARRDFTMNAIAMDMDGNLIDPFDGAKDIQEELIRCVGRPKDRFKEDPLRILRAARFQAQLGFQVHTKTAEYMGKQAPLLLSVSRERWMMELDKLIMGKHADEGIFLMAETGVLAYLLPDLSLQYNYEQNSPYHQYTLLDHTLRVLMHPSLPDDINVKWAALLHDIGKPYVCTWNKKGYCNYVNHEIMGAELVDRIALTLKWSRERQRTVHELVLNHMDDSSVLRQADKDSH